jgi:hypothetical protein
MKQREITGIVGEAGSAGGRASGAGGAGEEDANGGGGSSSSGLANRHLRVGMAPGGIHHTNADEALLVSE